VFFSWTRYKEWSTPSVASTIIACDYQALSDTALTQLLL
jgi:hypothetical protein